MQQDAIEMKDRMIFEDEGKRERRMDGLGVEGGIYVASV